jgi:hypothetical protein
VNLFSLSVNFLWIFLEKTKNKQFCISVDNSTTSNGLPLIYWRHNFLKNQASPTLWQTSLASYWYDSKFQNNLSEYIKKPVPLNTFCHNFWTHALKNPEKHRHIEKSGIFAGSDSNPFFLIFFLPILFSKFSLNLINFFFVILVCLEKKPSFYYAKLKIKKKTLTP